MGEGMITPLYLPHDYDKKEDVVCATPSTSNVLEVRMTEIIISRQEAISQGLKRYFTGKPCKYGHIDYRYTNGRKCCSCSIIELRKKYKENTRSELDRAKTYRENNPDKVLESGRKSAKKHREKRAKYTSDWHKKNKEHAQQYRTQNLEKYRMHAQNRRARIHDSGGFFTLKQIHALRVLQKDKCVNCKKSIKTNMHIDHIMPIAKGGSNDIKNIQLLCPKCNFKKNDTDPIIWAQQNGRLL